MAALREKGSYPHTRENIVPIDLNHHSVRIQALMPNFAQTPSIHRLDHIIQLCEGGYAGNTGQSRSGGTIITWQKRAA